MLAPTGQLEEEARFPRREFAFQPARTLSLPEIERYDMRILPQLWVIRGTLLPLLLCKCRNFVYFLR